MRQFKIEQKRLKEIKKATLIKLIPFYLLVLVFAIIMSYFQPKQNNSSDTSIYIFPFIGVFFAVILFRSVNKIMKAFQTYTLTIAENEITRSQVNLPTITMSTFDIKEIVKDVNGGFTIKGTHKSDVISIPPQIENYEEVKGLLLQFGEISSEGEVPFFKRFPVIVQVLVLALMATVYISKNKWIVGVSGTALLLAMGYSFIKIQTTKNVAPKIKIMSWCVLLVAVSIIGVMYFKLTDFFVGSDY